MVSAVVLTGWYIGFAITGAVIAVVVVLVGIILGLARRIGGQAMAITQDLDRSRANTLALWDVEILNNSVGAIITAAGQARGVLAGGE